MTDHTPQQAEHKVANWLVSRGCRILYRNLRFRACELDIVAWTGQGLIVVEVKMRSDPNLEIATLLPFQKKKSLIRGLRRIICQTNLDIEWARIDLAVVRRSDLRIMHYIDGVIALEEYENWGSH